MPKKAPTENSPASKATKSATKSATKTTASTKIALDHEGAATAASTAPAALPASPADSQIQKLLQHFREQAAGLPPATKSKLDEAMAQLAKSPAKALAAAKALAKELGVSVASITMYDAMAAASFEIAGGAKKPAPAAEAAGTCHAAARAMERKLKLAVDLERAVAWASVLATRGAVWAKEIALLIKDLRAKKQLDEVPRLVVAAIDTVREVEALSPEVVLALEPLGGALARHLVLGWIAGAPKRFESVEDDFWEKAPGALALALEGDPSLVAWAATHLPDGPGGLEAILHARLTERIAQSCPEHARAIGQHLLMLTERDRSGLKLLSLEGLLRPLVPVLEARGDALSLLQTKTGSEKDYYAPHVAEMLLGIGAPLQIAGHGVFQLYAWAHIPLDQPFQQLTRLGQHPLLAARLAESLAQSVENTALSQIAAKCAGAEGARGALGVFATLATTLAEGGTLGGFRMLQSMLGKLCQPGVLEACPAIGEAIESLDPVRLLQGQMRGGLLDEWGWPALDEAVKLLGSEANGEINWCRHSCFPHLTLTSGDRALVVGPEGVVLDHRDPILKDESFKHLRRAVFVEGDLFLEAGDYRARWLRGGQDIARADLCGLVDLLGGPEETGAPGKTGPVIHLEGPPLERGTTTLGGHYRGWSAWCDGRFVYPDGHRVEVITGKSVDDARPPLFAQAMGGSEKPDEAFLLPVPRRALRSPLGAREGVGGFVSFKAATGVIHGVGCDGRRVERRVGHGWYALEGIITFPEREGYYPLIRGHEGQWVYRPDCEMALACWKGDGASSTWSGGPLRLPMEWWHLFLPRDPAGSRALANASLQTARELHEATRQALGGELVEGRKPIPEITGYEGLRIILDEKEDEPNPLTHWPRIAVAVKEALPEVTDPHLLAGLVRTAVLSVEIEGDLADLRARVELARSDAKQATLKNRDVRHLDAFFEAGFDMPGRWGQDRLGQQIEDVVAFLFGERPPVPEAARPLRVTPSACFVAWERLLELGAELFPVLLGAATPEVARRELRQLLEFFEKTPLAEPRDDVRLAFFQFEQAPFPGLGHDNKDRLLEWENRYFLRCRQFGAPLTFVALEVTRDGQFRTPPGASLAREVSLALRADRARIQRALALLDERGPLPFQPAAALKLSEATGILQETAGLLLGGCHLLEPEKEGRGLLNATAKHLGYARHELAVDPLHRIVASAVPRNLEELYEPEISGIAGADGESHVARMARLWNAALGTRHTLPLEIVDRMEADIKNPHPPFIEAARTLQAPELFAAATEDVTWVHRPFKSYAPRALDFGSVPSGWPLHHDATDGGWVPRWPNPRRAFSYEALGWYMKYLSWAYLELPVGHELRRGAGALVKLVRARLSASQHLLPVAHGPVTDVPAFQAFVKDLGSKPYAAGDAGPRASGVERDGLIVVYADGAQPSGMLCSLRTAELGAETSLSRVARHLGIEATSRAGAVAGAHVELLPYWWLYSIWCTGAFRRIADDLQNPSVPEGRYVADPRASAPAVVSEVAQRLKLGDDSTTLLLQIRWLPNPTPRHVQRYNDWKAADYRSAVAPLVERGLVIEKGHQGTDRTHFLPGPMAFFERYPGPLETAKLEAYGLTPNQRPPLDVPLPIVDLPTLFGSEP